MFSLRPCRPTLRSQIDGIPAYVPPERRELTWERPEAADVILSNSKIVVRFGGDRAFYAPKQDYIQLPDPAVFHTPEDFAATALHEAAHASGAKHRLDRDLTGRFGSAAHAQEELRAELSSCFVGSVLNLPCDIPNHANYLASWAAKLREDKREIFRAAADAQRIADYLLAFHPDYAASLEPSPGDDEELKPTRRRPRDGRLLDRMDARDHLASSHALGGRH